MDKKSIVIAIILFVICFPIGIGYIIYKLVAKKPDETPVTSWEEERSQLKQAHEGRLEALKSKYGIPERVVIIGAFRDELVVFDKLKKFVIGQKEYGYGDILSYRVLEKRVSLDGTEKVITKTNLKSVVGRSLVGGIIAGPAGAIIGGATASKTSVVSNSSTDDVFYNIEVKLKDISNPLLTIECYSEDDAADIDGIFSYMASCK